ncbi:MAG: caspase family protein [Elusimicrobia bacterium]|nr:caspase family protein [Elusimicrobiota bacterium]
MRRFLPLIPLVAAFYACAFPVIYAPTAAPTVQLPSAQLPKLFLEDVSDNVGRGEVYAPGETRLDIDTDVVWADVVRVALKTELQRLGWQLTEDPAEAGARLKATVEKARADCRVYRADLHMDGAVRIGLVFKNPDGRAVWAGRLEAAKTAPTTWQSVSCDISAGFVRDAWNVAFNAAIPKLGPLLAEDRPWERLGKAGTARAVADVVPARAPSAALSDIDRLPAAGAANPHSYAVVIGVEHYREKLPDAEFAASDAELSAKYLERVLGVPEANVALLTDGRATKSDFEKYFENWLPNHVEAGDTVYVYYSGHGAPNPAKGDSYLVPYDGDPTYIETTGYPVKRLFDQLAKLPAKQVYVAMDSCFSGAGGRSVIAKGARPLVSVVQTDVPAKLTVLAASAGDQISNTYQQKGHGLFTYFFLKGIKEKGGDFRAVFDYLKPEVTRVARRDDNADQVPQWMEGR